MKKQFLGYIITVFALLATVIAFGQSGNKFYASIDDYNNNLPIAGFEIEDKGLGSNSVVLVSENGTKRTRLSKLPSELYTYNGDLYRTYKTWTHQVLIVGPICYYLLVGGNYQVEGEHYSQYFSETITSKLNRYSDDWLKKYLIKYDLYEDYKKEAPKRVMIDDPKNTFKSQQFKRNVKYIKLLNEKILNSNS